ncbi:hypothetical protein ILYODFUR_027892 [Ilyodon furcidens]|uniref:Uncharacterized protein n=1 Tax=Ilyodon furcidens TaxID=33524 RepID=A0ABV0TMA0_9TELE
MKTLEYYVKPNLISFRSEVSKFQLPSSTRAEQQPCVSRGQSQRCCQDLHHDRCSPTGRAVTTPDKMEEQLFRSVEGQAASDEEEDRRTEEQQRQVEEVKRILTRLSCCGQRCGDKAVKKLTFNHGSLRSEESHGAVVELLERVTRLHKELELKESQAEMNMDQAMTWRCTAGISNSSGRDTSKLWTGTNGWPTVKPKQKPIKQPNCLPSTHSAVHLDSLPDQMFCCWRSQTPKV